MATVCKKALFLIYLSSKLFGVILRIASDEGLLLLIEILRTQMHSYSE
jgi:hypothetical protein